MAFLQIKNITIEGISACVPKSVESIQDYNYISDKEKAVFTFGTGVEERRIADLSTCTSDMCYAAAQKLILDTNIDIEDIDILIFVSQSPDYFLPATSILLQERLGLKKNTIAFDINLGCSGYVYGLSVIANLLQQPNLNRAMLLCGDKSSFSASKKDKSTYPLFGDAGSATLLKRNDKAHPLYFNLQSDGKGWESIIIRGGGTRVPYSKETTEVKSISPGIERSLTDLELNGDAVFNFALTEVKPNIDQLLDHMNFQIEDLDYFVFHQANKLINESVRKKLKVPKEKVPYSIQSYGNTSSASIPLTMVTQLKNKLTAEKNILICGFGVGFSWGSAIIQKNKIHISDLVEI